MCYNEPDCEYECRGCESLLSVITTLETQLAAANEAVRELAGICAMVNDNDPDHDRDFIAWKIGQINNPLARASVEKAGKQ